MFASRYLRQSQWALLLALLAAGCEGKGGQAPAGGSDAEGMKVPAGAELIADGRGNIARIAMGRGTIYVVDSADGRVLHAGPIEFGQKVILYPQARQLIVNGVVAEGVEIDPGKNYRIYFSRG